MSVIKQAKFAIPLFIFILIILLLWRSLSLHPTEVPSPLINKSVPVFQLPTLLDSRKTTTNHDLVGHVSLVNVWATWCYACAQEHEFLLHLSKTEKVFIYGLNYKDDADAAKTWLKKYGNPYQIIAVDQDGSAAIDWGVYGTPETFVIDKKGIIRYKQIGPITAEVWSHDLKPLIDRLRNEPE